MKGIHSRNNYGGIAFNKHLWPIIERVFLEEGPEGRRVGVDYSNKGFECWCALFCRNSMVLFSSCSQSIELSQTLFTLRYIMEIVADFYCISRYPENMSIFKEIYKNNQDNKITSYKDFCPEISRYKIYKYADDGESIDTSTKGRIKDCFGDEGEKTYDYLCSFTHLNYIGGILDMRFSSNGNLQSFRFVLPLLKLYPKCLISMVESSSLITGVGLDEDISGEVNNRFESTILSINQSLSQELLFGNSRFS